MRRTTASTSRARTSCCQRDSFGTRPRRNHMSAIIGRLSFDSEEILARTVLDRMLDASVRRGLETRSLFTAPGIALGSIGAAGEHATVATCTGQHQHVRAFVDSQLTNASELRAAL